MLAWCLRNVQPSEAIQGSTFEEFWENVSSVRLYDLRPNLTLGRVSDLGCIS